ncbi:Transcription factor bHLH130 [Zea mays]|uniref:Transcription factor bHLH130 n=1 Tax=Zea mays TaxID=4577 RepID=A0A3L6EZE0_MAIZE|nr:Transcription factor bHLH130 [Zea mays]
MASIEKFLQFQDDVPCKIRAKRGCATHLRNIAERVRRTKISERIRKLQELVPNMDKQTNTSDMLDLAVDYIKDLQRQVKQARASNTLAEALMHTIHDLQNSKASSLGIEKDGNGTMASSSSIQMIGRRYESPEVLANECPGPDEDDH